MEVEAYGEAAGGGVGAGGGGDDGVADFGGVNPDMDLSMEEDMQGSNVSRQ